MDAYSSTYSYPMFPLQVANPMTDVSIDTEGNISYGKHTSCVAAENDQEYTYMSSEVSSAVPQPYLCKHICDLYHISILMQYYYKCFSHLYTLLYTAPATCLSQSPSTGERDPLPLPSQGQGSESGNDENIYDN